MKNIKSYEVKVSTKYPVAGLRDNSIYIDAVNVADAKKQVRRQIADGSMRGNPFILTVLPVA